MATSGMETVIWLHHLPSAVVVVGLTALPAGASAAFTAAPVTPFGKRPANAATSRKSIRNSLHLTTSRPFASAPNRVGALSLSLRTWTPSTDRAKPASGVGG